MEVMASVDNSEESSLEGEGGHFRTFTLVREGLEQPLVGLESLLD